MQEADTAKSTAQAIMTCLGKGMPFAVYRLPGAGMQRMVIQISPDEIVLDANDIGQGHHGFLFAPFSLDKGDIILIRPDIVIRGEPGAKELEDIMALDVNINTYSQTPLPEDTDRHTHIGNVNKAVDAIRARKLDKVVLSRVKTLPGDFQPFAQRIFSALCESYTHAFVSLVSTRGQVWIGASPEPFLCAESERLLTVSLAGTRIAHESNYDMGRWGDKERWEQELVSRHIERVLHVHSISDIVKKGPYITAAGNVLHLRTDYSFSLTSLPGEISSIITALHPTPAVCGMDTSAALEFIHSTENHDRGYFTGFLGPVGIDGILQLYVNLRCIRILKSGATLYMGGGITRDSVAEDEWHETEIKSETLLTVLAQVME